MGRGGKGKDNPVVWGAVVVVEVLSPRALRWRQKVRAIRSASRIYQRIGRVLRAQGLDSLRRRARVSGLHKLGWVVVAYLAGLLPGARRWSQTRTLGPADELIGRYCREVGLLD